MNDDNKGPRMYEPFLNAAQEGREDVVQDMLAKGADINAQNDSGESALFIAVKEGHAKVIGTLLGKGADVNTKSIGVTGFVTSYS